MSKYQLTLSPEYVSDWTYVEAVRELFQNALDNQATTPENEMYFNYENGTLTIGNKTSVLTMDTLLLGSSSKRDDNKTIGKHGEGYKVALMVLLREGKSVTIYNYGAREIWNTRLVKSRKYNGALITEIDVTKKAFFQSVPSHDLMITVEGVSEKEYSDIVKSNLHLQEDIEELISPKGMGSILTSEKYQGKIYVNGLYITTNDKFTYGYNIAPEHIRLDRDRKLVDTFNLSLTTSKMWRYMDMPSRVSDMIALGLIDVEYIKNSKLYVDYSEEDAIDRTIKETLKDNFVNVYGKNAVPVSDNSDLAKVNRLAKSPVKPVMVPSTVKSYIEDSLDLPEELTTTPLEALEDWFEKVSSKLTDKEKDDFDVIFKELKEGHYPF